MGRSSILTAPSAQLGTMVLAAGGPQASTYQLEWEGPFNPGQTTFLGTTFWANVFDGQPVIVSLTQLLSISVSDAAWWVITG